MKILGVGLSRTGTTSLTHALEILGFKCIHYDRYRLTDILDGSNKNPDFRRYDDVDAVIDVPSVFFYREILDAYPASKAILTIRDVSAWWKSIEYHLNNRYPIKQLDPSLLNCIAQVFGIKRWVKTLEDRDRFMSLVRNWGYGSVTPHEFLYKKRYQDHNQHVQAEVPAHRLLIMNITNGDGWDKLCLFLELPVPSVPFPYRNKTSGSEDPDH
jgi:hypothetical protein